MEPQTNNLTTVAKAAKDFDVTTTTIYGWLKDGILNGELVVNLRLIRKDAVYATLLKERKAITEAEHE